MMDLNAGERQMALNEVYRKKIFICISRIFFNYFKTSENLTTHII